MLKLGNFIVFLTLCCMALACTSGPIASDSNEQSGDEPTDPANDNANDAGDDTSTDLDSDTGDIDGSTVVLRPIDPRNPSAPSDDGITTQSQSNFEPLVYDDWEDYLVQDTCRDSAGVAIAGDPAGDCVHSNLQPGEVVYGGFRYATSQHDFVMHALPRRAYLDDGTLIPSVFVLFDSGNGADGKGLYDYDDPGCKVPGSICLTGGDTDIADIVEARWNSAQSYSTISIAATAHYQTGGFWAFHTGSPASAPDGWNLADKTATPVTVPIELSIFEGPDASNLRGYVDMHASDVAVCHALNFQAAPSSCGLPSYNRWRKLDQVYMGHGKTFSDVLISMHANNVNDCTGHLEMYLHSREYGLMSHSAWKKAGCSTAAPANNGCVANSGVSSPMVFVLGPERIAMERVACTATVADGPSYPFDSDAMASVKRGAVAADTPIDARYGLGNLLLNGQFAWPDLQPWQSAGLAVQKVAAPSPAKFNDWVQLRGQSSAGSFYQEIDLRAVAEVLAEKWLRVGLRAARGAEPVSAKLVVEAYDAANALISSYELPVAPNSTITDGFGELIEAELQLAAAAQTLKLQVLLPEGQVINIDDIFLAH